ncbi:MAG: tetratricopeptide repeat protein, partial [Pleurocapsa sp.]
LWTQGQSFLSQKLFNLITEHQDKVVAGKEAEQVDYLIETKILKNWRNQAAGKHFQTLETRLLNNQKCQPIKLLRLYQQILMRKVAISNNQEQQELIKMGLVVKQQNYLIVANRIYESVFNLSWIEEKLDEINSVRRLDNGVVPIRSTIVSSSQKKGQTSRSLKNLLLLLTLIALLLLFLNNLTKRIRIRTAFKKGNQLLQQKSFNKAIAEYNTLLHIDSNYFQAWTNRGYALAGLKKYEEMRESCSTATIINPAAVYAWNCQGEALHNLKREQEAIASFDKAISLDKTDPIFLINKSESLKSLGEDKQSLVTISQAIEVLEQIEENEGKDKISSEFAVDLTFRGNGYRKQEKYEPAIFNYNRALEYSPNYFPAQIGKGIILNRVKRYIEAQEEFESILENKELSAARQAQTWFYLGQTFCQSGQNSKSITAFEKAIEQNPDYSAAKQAKQNCQ